MSKRIISFTGHRDRQIDERYLQRLVKKYPKAFWCHGGAGVFTKKANKEGFDYQVHQFAQEHGIPEIIITPPYLRYKDKTAPLIRNKYIVGMANLFLVACYDGREGGGTVNTMKHAKKANLPVVKINPDDEYEEPDEDDE